MDCDYFMAEGAFIFEMEDQAPRERLLVEAAARGDVQTVTKLLALGVKVDAPSYCRTLSRDCENFKTPLQMACAYNHVECADTLIANGANVNAKDAFDFTAMHFAAEKGHLSCLKRLLVANADGSIPSKMGSDPYVGHTDGTTPLHLAVRMNHAECVKLLIQYGADYNVVDASGCTSLYLAVQRSHRDCVLAHVRSAFGKNILSLPCRLTGDTPLHYAVKDSKTEFIEEFLKSGARLDHLNRQGFSPLHLAVLPHCSSRTFLIAMRDYEPEFISQPDRNILEMLVLQGSNTDINQRDGAGLTALQHAHNLSRSTRTELMTFLISYGANVHVHVKKSRISSIGILILGSRALLAHELECISKEDFEVLRYIVRSLLHVPRLSTLRVFPRLPSAVLPPMHVALGNELLLWDPMAPSCAPPGVKDRDTSILLSRASQEEVSMYEQKHTWYEAIASNPRTLQHYCRYAIRKAVGPLSTKHIKQLPVPELLQSYLLLKYGD